MSMLSRFATLGGGGDPYWNNVSYLLVGNGANGTTTNIVDSSKNNLTTNIISSVVISTAQSKYGSGSVYFAGTGGYLSVPNNSLLYFGTGDFTIELWFNFSTIPTAAATFLSMYGGEVNGWSFQFRGESNNVFRFGNGDATLLDSSSQTLSNNTWYYLAVTRSGTSLKLFLNGSQIGSATNSTSLTATQQMTIGGLYALGAIYQQFTGYLYDVRITKGVARTITSSPSGPFPIG